MEGCLGHERKITGKKGNLTGQNVDKERRESGSYPWAWRGAGSGRVFTRKSKTEVSAAEVSLS